MVKVSSCFNGVWIAKQIWEDSSLTWFQKCFVAKIENDKSCSMSRLDLAKLFEIKESTLSNFVSQLRARKVLIGRIGKLSVSPKYRKAL